MARRSSTSSRANSCRVLATGSVTSMVSTSVCARVASAQPAGVYFQQQGVQLVDHAYTLPCQVVAVFVEQAEHGCGGLAGYCGDVLVVGGDQCHGCGVHWVGLASPAPGQFPHPSAGCGRDIHDRLQHRRTAREPGTSRRRCRPRAG